MKKPLKKLPDNPQYKNVFYRNLKKQRNRINLVVLKKGSIGFRALEDFKLTFNEIEAVRKCVGFNYKSIKIWFNTEFNIPVRSKSSSSRMGKGCGKLKNWVWNVKKGSIFIELDTIPLILIFKIFKIITNKLQIKLALVSRSFKA